MNNVDVKIYSKQVYPTHSDESNENHMGQLSIKNESIYITYKEKGITTIIKVKNKNVYVKRIGDLKGNLQFDTRNPYKTIYYTPYGSMEIEIITHDLQVYILEKGVKVVIEYDILMEGKEVSSNEYMIIAN